MASSAPGSRSSSKADRKAAVASSAKGGGRGLRSEKAELRTVQTLVSRGRQQGYLMSALPELAGHFERNVGTQTEPP